MNMANVLKQFGVKNRHWQRSVAPLEALIVLYQAMHAKLQRRIRMVIEIAGEPSVLFLIVN